MDIRALVLFLCSALLAVQGRADALPGADEVSGADEVPGSDPGSDPGSELGSDRERYSYAVGAALARDIAAQGARIDRDALLMALRDVLEGKGLRMSPEQMRSALGGRQQERLSTGRENLILGKAFLADNGRREGVVTSSSGLQYQVLETGDGALPTLEDTVVVHYRGSLLDGSEFDSSHARAEPPELPVSRLIAGWQEALQAMPEGARWRIWVPPDLAYGARGAGDRIGPHETLVFDLELLQIK